MPERPELGVYLKDSAPLIRAAKRMMVARSTLLDPEEALPRPGQVTVYVCNHGPMFAPLAAPVLTVDHLLQHGGYDDLVAVTLFHWALEWFPGLAPLFRRYLGHSTRELRSLPDLIEKMKARRFHIIGTAPEGYSCVLAYDDPVGPFTRHGLLVAALESDADLVLTAQKGVEIYGRRFPLPLVGALPITLGAKGLVVPFWRPGLRADVTLRHRRYEPTITAAERAQLAPDEQRAQLREETARIHRALSHLYASIC